ncbi:MAG: hypothetical protein ABIU95_08165 [Burkholderiales bacterium]
MARRACAVLHLIQEKFLVLELFIVAWRRSWVFQRRLERRSGRAYERTTLPTD